MELDSYFPSSTIWSHTKFSPLFAHEINYCRLFLKFFDNKENRNRKIANYKYFNLINKTVKILSHNLGLKQPSKCVKLPVILWSQQHRYQKLIVISILMKTPFIYQLNRKNRKRLTDWKCLLPLFLFLLFFFFFSKRSKHKKREAAIQS